MIASLKKLADQKGEERKELLKRSNIPNYLLSAFGGDLNRTLQFIENVENLPTEELDEHIVGNCGRARVSAHLEQVGGADFFCGADPNDVKHYVYEYHFGTGEYEEPEEDYSSNSGDSDFAEALRRAGLVK